jgi:hypothetical protein
MAKSMNLQKTVIATRENLNIGSIVNQALIDILISKQIITEEEMLYYIGKISTEKVNIIKRLS